MTDRPESLIELGQTLCFRLLAIVNSSRHHWPCLYGKDGPLLDLGLYFHNETSLVDAYLLVIKDLILPIDSARQEVAALEEIRQEFKVLTGLFLSLEGLGPIPLDQLGETVEAIERSQAMLRQILVRLIRGLSTAHGGIDAAALDAKFALYDPGAGKGKPRVSDCFHSIMKS